MTGQICLKSSGTDGIIPGGEKPKKGDRLCAQQQTEPGLIALRRISSARRRRRIRAAIEKIPRMSVGGRPRRQNKSGIGGGILWSRSQCGGGFRMTGSIPRFQISCNLMCLQFNVLLCSTNMVRIMNLTARGVGLPHAEIRRRFLLLKSTPGGPELRGYVGVGLSVDQTCDVRSE